MPKQETISTSHARLEHFTCNYLFSVSTERQNRLSPVKYVVVSQRLEKDHVRVEVQNEVTLAVQIGSQLSWATAVDRVEVANWSENPIKFVGCGCVADSFHLNEYLVVPPHLAILCTRICRPMAGGRETVDSINDLLLCNNYFVFMYRSLAFRIESVEHTMISTARRGRGTVAALQQW